MKTTRLFLISSVIAALMLTGCGAPTKKVEEPKKMEPVPIKTGLGSHAELLNGLSDQINLDRVEGKDTYMGYTPDRTTGGNQFVSLVIYGPPEAAYHAFFSVALPYDENPDPAKYPEFMRRNQKLLDTFLHNIFKGNIPEEFKKELETAKKNPDKKRTLVIGGRNVKINYDLTKRIEIDVR
ncbi:MAG: hypothetical protein V1899_11870 [Planctomycetota bacterium]